MKNKVALSSFEDKRYYVNLGEPLTLACALAVPYF